MLFAHILSPTCLLLFLCLSLLSVRHTCSDSPRRAAQRRVIENFDQDVDEDEQAPYHSEQEFDPTRDNGDYVEGTVDTSESIWNEGDEEDREYKQETDDEGNLIITQIISV